MADLTATVYNINSVHCLLYSLYKTVLILKAMLIPGAHWASTITELEGFRWLMYRNEWDFVEVGLANSTLFCIIGKYATTTVVTEQIKS